LEEWWIRTQGVWKAADRSPKWQLGYNRICGPSWSSWDKKNDDATYDYRQADTVWESWLMYAMYATTSNATKKTKSNSSAARAKKKAGDQPGASSKIPRTGAADVDNDPPGCGGDLALCQLDDLPEV
jgi:hypothetical protein